MDLNQAFLGNDGKFNPALYGRDQLHLNDQGYVAWANALSPLLDEYGYQVIHKQEVGHHPHSLEDPQPIVDFVTKGAR